MAQTLGEIYELARSLLDDAEGTRFTDQLLSPLVNSSYRKIQRRMAENGIPVLTDEAEVPVSAGQTQISDAGGAVPALPTDLILPHKLLEKETGSSEKFQPMRRLAGGLPDLEQIERLRYWDWFGNRIDLIGATKNVTVLVRYEKELPKLASPSDKPLIRDAADAIAHGGAYQASRGHNELALAMRYEGEFESLVRQMLNRNVKAEQHRARRRRSYGFRRGAYL